MALDGLRTASFSQLRLGLDGRQARGTMHAMHGCSECVWPTATAAVPEMEYTQQANLI
jgi:hypothetical protein